MGGEDMIMHIVRHQTLSEDQTGELAAGEDELLQVLGSTCYVHDAYG